ncbi:ABC transporter [Kitasatospora herbaricolor]|uniref:ABC transporter n=1 Tax=Kitasatospora indigofera TaxID=67307 RepID=A0A919KKP2_9ACTN|nr:MULTISPECIES: hypothetical protein [Kitasatospora]MDQ0311628.1 hypothetical protein [Kitasatospora herbaricolor]GGU95617.1 ABC transporter [Kitasatospora herbaricolor]GHH62816.1 ABC transporter [Kitasatospora indigofera]
MTVSAGTALRAEWTKITTLRTTWSVPLAGTLLGILASALVCALIGDVQELLIQDPSVGIHYGLTVFQTAFVCFGVLLLGQEFNSGSVLPALLAVPRRGLLYGSKLAVGAGYGLALGLLLSAGSFAAARATLDHPAGWTDPGVPRSLAAAALYPPLMIVFCLGVTAMLGNMTAAMGLLVPTLLVGTTLLGAVPGVRELVPFLPDKAGQYGIRYATDPDVPFPHGTGTLLLALWAGAAAYGGLRRFRRYEG